MLNHVVLVGRLVEEPEVKELKNGKKVSNITLAVPRYYKNESGVYEADFIPCTLWQGIAEKTKEYCKKGDVLGIKGRLQKNENEELKIIAEKVTFLSSNNN